MSADADQLSVDVIAAERGASAGAYLELAKPRITLMVLLTALMGYRSSGPAQGAGLAALALTLCGTGLVAAGASVFNMLLERTRDARMERTRLRPLPTGRVRPAEASLFGTALTLAGLGLLAWIGPWPAAVALVTWLSYVLLYTPLKPRTALATLVGAVPGALPPVIGWTAAQGRPEAGAWLLFAILFLWQIPHFLAIAWIYRDDYRRGGFPMLPVVDGDGRLTARQAFANALALVPISLTPAVAGMAGSAYCVGALLLGLAYAASAWRLTRRRTARAARELFLVSIAYLPLLAALLLLDARP